jgi:hypothetical protein
MRDALLKSNVLGVGEPMTPREARDKELETMHLREIAEHEAAHAVAAEALGFKVSSARMENENSGYCRYAKGGTTLEDAIITMAPEVWLTRFRRAEFPYGPRGLQPDHRELAKIGDRVLIREAYEHCRELLRQNSAFVLATADQIEKTGSFWGW